MCLPSLANFISETDAIISVKKDLDPGASCSSNLYKMPQLNQIIAWNFSDINWLKMSAAIGNGNFIKHCLLTMINTTQEVQGNY